MKNLLLIIIFLSCFQTSYTQSFEENKNQWFYGTIILENGDSLMGKVQTNIKAGEIKIQDDHDLIKTFSTLQVSEFSFYDIYAKNKRYFHKLDYTPLKSNRSRSGFFGLILNRPDKVSIYYKYVVKPTVFRDVYSFVSGYAEIYLKFPNGELKNFGGTKSSLFEILPDNQDKIKAFLRKSENKELILLQVLDIVKVIDFYNSL
jgi:hypothetical protein